jgi:hypothetical protein
VVVTSANEEGDWLDALRRGTAAHVASQDRVRVDDARIVAVARAEVAAADLAPPAWDVPSDPGSDPATEAAWLLAYNALNFSYYPDGGAPRWVAAVDGAPVGEDDEALGVMAALGAALRAGVPLADGAWLADRDAAGLDALLPTWPGAGPLPLADRRLAGLRELGRAWVAHGGPLGLLARGGGDAPALVQALVRALPSWEDTRADGRLPFRKRAQLCAAMLHARAVAAGRPGLARMSALTVFADYRLPQVLRGDGILLLAPDLVDRIAQGVPFDAGEPDEVALRAATVVAGERLVAALRPRFPDVDALRVDHYLWRRAVTLQDRLPGFHRCRCTDY